LAVGDVLNRDIKIYLQRNIEEKEQEVEKGVDMTF